MCSHVQYTVSLNPKISFSLFTFQSHLFYGPWIIELVYENGFDFAKMLGIFSFNCKVGIHGEGDAVAHVLGPKLPS